jgi:starch phosphorylase
MTKYKRAELIFFDLEVIRKVNQIGKIQPIFGDKAHHSDGVEKLLSRTFSKISEYLQNK